MKSIAEVKQMCHLDDDGHWIWKGALSAGRPNVTAPDYTANGGAQKSQRGPRAVWHLKTKQAVPVGHRVFRTCDNPLCVNPAHVVSRSCKEWGEEIAQTGVWKGDPRKIIANRAKNMKRSAVTPAKLVTVQTSPHKSGQQLAQELGLSENVVSRIRTGKFKSIAVGNPFAALICR